MTSGLVHRRLLRVSCFVLSCLLSCVAANLSYAQEAQAGRWRLAQVLSGQGAYETKGGVASGVQAYEFISADGNGGKVRVKTLCQDEKTGTHEGGPAHWQAHLFTWTFSRDVNTVAPGDAFDVRITCRREDTTGCRIEVSPKADLGVAMASGSMLVEKAGLKNIGEVFGLQAVETVNDTKSFRITVSKEAGAMNAWFGFGIIGKWWMQLEIVYVYEPTGSGGGGQGGPIRPGPQVGPEPPVVPDKTAVTADMRQAGYDAMQKGDLQLAIKCFNAALQKDPSDVLSVIGRGDAQDLGGNCRLAIDDYRAAVKMGSPKTDNILDRFRVDEVPAKLTEVLLFTGRLEEADVELKQMETAPNPWAAMMRGRYCTELGDEDLAKKWYAYAIQQDPTLGNTAYDVTNRWLQQRQWSRAIFWCDLALHLNPGNASVHYARGVAYQGLGAPVEAVRAFRSYLRADSTSEWAAKARAAVADLEKPR